jgi:hypothetical protein
VNAVIIVFKGNLEKKGEGLEGTIFQDPTPIQIYKETNSSFFLIIGGIVDHHCLNFLFIFNAVYF